MLMFMNLQVIWNLTDLCYIWLGGSASGCDCLSYGLGLVLIHTYLLCGPGKRDSSYSRHAFLMEKHQSIKTESNYKNMFMTSAFIINMKILMANWNEMTKPKVIGEI